jgi:hypothetical protein
MTEIGFWPTWLLTTLAAWRLTHLLANEDGPADLVLRLRTLLGDSGIGHLMDCFQCLSLWVAAPLALIVSTEWLTWLIAWLGLSGAACLLERWGRQVEAIQAPPLLIGGDIDHGMLWPRQGSSQEKPGGESAGDTG